MHEQSNLKNLKVIGTLTLLILQLYQNLATDLVKCANRGNFLFSWRNNASISFQVTCKMFCGNVQFGLNLKFKEVDVDNYF